MKRFPVASLALLLFAATVRSAFAPEDRTAVGGVVLPATNYFLLALLGLFALWVALFLYRKRGDVFKLGPMFLR